VLNFVRWGTLVLVGTIAGLEVRVWNVETALSRVMQLLVTNDATRVLEFYTTACIG
jgi:hypothetical protein